MSVTKLPPVNYEKLNHLFQKLPFSGKCKNCGQEFDDETYYLCHHPCHQENYRKTCPPKLYDPTVFQCTLCSKVATNFTNLRYHYQYHAARRFQCLKCDYNAHSLAEVRRHVQKHLDEKLFPCKLCFRQYPDCKSLKEHLIRHHRGEAAYICSLCVNPYKDQVQFREHINKHYDEAERHGTEVGKLFDLRTGTTPSGHPVKDAFRIRSKHKKRSSQIDDDSWAPKRPSVTFVQDISYKPAVVNSGVANLIPQSSNGVKRQTASKGSAPRHTINYKQVAVNTGATNLMPQSSNGGERQTATKVSFPVQRINKILIGNRCSTFEPKRVLKNDPELPYYGSYPRRDKRTIEQYQDPIKTIDVGTFVPPTVGLADCIEAD